MRPSIRSASAPATMPAACGSRLSQRANVLWKKQLAEYEAPPMDPAVDEALLDYMNRRKASFPDSNV